MQTLHLILHSNFFKCLVFTRKFQISGFKEKGRFLCRFCGGKACKNENYLLNKKAIIKGLNSD